MTTQRFDVMPKLALCLLACVALAACASSKDGQDAGTHDAGVTDAGSDAGSGADAGSSDAGADAGGVDAGTDAGTTDAGEADAGADAGVSDAGADAGSADAGSDAGSADAGSDAGSADAGSGGADAGTDGGTATNYPPLDPAVITNVLTAASGALTDIMASTSTHATRNAQFAAWLATREEFRESGVDEQGDSVWGQLTNGQLYVATTNFDDGASTSSGPRRLPPQFSHPQQETRPQPMRPQPMRPQPMRSQPSQSPYLRPQLDLRDAPTRDLALASKPANLPGSTQARLLLSVDPSLFDIPNSEIAGWLRDGNYTVINQAATVANLKQVQGDGVFFWITHGSYAVDPAAHVSVWTLWTADAVTDANNAAFKDDLDDHSLVYFTANNEFDPVTKKFTARTHYAITDNFVTKYQWSFADYPFIFVDACHSDQYGMANSLMARASKVGTSFGWSDTVYTDAAARAPRFAFDRLLGNSKAAPAPSTAQRPFDGSAVFRELHAVGADTSAANATVIVARSGAPPALRPSIMRMEVTERLSESPLHGPTKLTLYGIFGDAQGKVKVGGVELPIQSWATDKIVATPADLPGPGFSGLVQVFSNSRESNAVELTQWHGQLKYQITPYPPQSTSTAVSHIDCDVYFRGDLHPYRDDAGADLLDPDPMNFRASQSSTCHWHMDGDPVTTFSWTSPLTHDLPFGLNGNVNSPYGDGYIFSGVVDKHEKTANLSFNYLGCVATASNGSPTPLTYTTLHDTNLTSQASGVGSDGYPTYSNNLPGTIGTDFVIPAQSLVGTSQDQQAGFDPKLNWTDFVPDNQPDVTKGEDENAP